MLSDDVATSVLFRDGTLNRCSTLVTVPSLCWTGNRPKPAPRSRRDGKSQRVFPDPGCTGSVFQNIHLDVNIM